VVSNLYSYVENSPLNKADADGLTIQCDGDKSRCQKDLAKLAPGTKVDSNGTVQKASLIHRLLNHLTGHGGGTALVTRLVNNHDVTHVTPDASEHAGHQTPGYVFYNPNGVSGVLVRGQDGQLVAGPTSGVDVLGHELIHQDHLERGIQDDSIVDHVFDKDNKKYREEGKEEEFRTVGFRPFAKRGDTTENQLRKEMGEPQRATYDNNPAHFTEVLPH